MNDLTKRQQEVFDLIESFIDSNGYPPTIRDLCALLGGCNMNATAGHLKSLRRKGMITWEPKAARSIQIVGRVRRGIALVGEVQPNGKVVIDG